MLVEVTQEHMNQAVYFSPSSCPIALAIQENGFANVRVDIQYISYDYKPAPFQYHFVEIKMDTRVIRWLNDFDSGEEVFPIKIEIDEKAGYATLVE